MKMGDKRQSKAKANKLDKTTASKRHANRGTRQTEQQAYGHRHGSEYQWKTSHNNNSSNSNGKKQTGRTGQVSRDFRCLSLYI
jgi:hypothetical protein